MSPPSFPFLCLLITLLCHGSASALYHIYTFCPNSTLFPPTDSASRSSVATLLSSLSSSANLSSTPGFYNSTAGTGTPGSPAFYGLYLCRGDDDPDTCRSCVAAASSDLSQNCPYARHAVVWYEECMLRYSNASIFGQANDSVYISMYNTQNITGNVTRFNDLLSVAFERVVTEAASGSSTLKFATEEDKYNENQSLYVMGQCTPDLSYIDCYNCLQVCVN